MGVGQGADGLVLGCRKTTRHCSVINNHGGDFLTGLYALFLVVRHRF